MRARAAEIGQALRSDTFEDRSSRHCLRPLVLSVCQSLAIYRPMLKRPLPAGFVVPAQPVEREKPPTGAEWIHEIKHDGYRMLARRDGDSVRLYSRKALDWTARLPAIAGEARTQKPAVSAQAAIRIKLCLAPVRRVRFVTFRCPIRKVAFYSEVLLSQVIQPNPKLCTSTSPPNASMPSRYS
jgi:hypothetical protein